MDSILRRTLCYGGQAEAQRADEPERSNGNPNKKSRFLRYAESNNAKRKNPDGANLICQSQDLLFAVIFQHRLEKGKKMAAGFFSLPHLSETRFELKNSEFCCEMKL